MLIASIAFPPWRRRIVPLSSCERPGVSQPSPWSIAVLRADHRVLWSADAIYMALHKVPAETAIGFHGQLKIDQCAFVHA